MHCSYLSPVNLFYSCLERVNVTPTWSVCNDSIHNVYTIITKSEVSNASLFCNLKNCCETIQGVLQDYHRIPWFYENTSIGDMYNAYMTDGYICSYIKESDSGSVLPQVLLIAMAATTAFGFYALYTHVQNRA